MPTQQGSAQAPKLLFDTLQLGLAPFNLDTTKGSNEQHKLHEIVPRQAGSHQTVADAAPAAGAVLPLPGVGFTSSMPAVLSRKAYSKAVSLRRSNLQQTPIHNKLLTL
jgi:hypothetical protein